MLDDTTSMPVFGGIDLLERAVEHLVGTLHTVPAEALPRRTPCAEWDLRALLAHLDDSLAALHEAVDGRIDDAVPRRPGGDPVTTVRDRARELIGAWSGSEGVDSVAVLGCPVTAGIVAGTGALEIAVHSWDIARACGRWRPLPRALAEDLLALAPLLVTEADRPTRFAAAVAPPSGADAGARLLGFLGREAR